MDGIGKGGLHLSGVLIAALFLTAWLLEEPPLVGERPAPRDFSKSPVELGQDVPARLWEDPFEAVIKHREKLLAASPSPESAPSAGGEQGASAAKQGADPAPASGAGTGQRSSSGAHPAPAAMGDCPGPPGEDAGHNTATLLARTLGQAARRAGGQHFAADFVFVSVSAAHWAEAQEGRLRTRYALLTSLFEQGYAPLHTEHIGYWCVMPPAQSSAGRHVASLGDAPGKGAQSRLIVPFEAFLRSPPTGLDGRLEPKRQGEGCASGQPGEGCPPGAGSAEPRLALVFWVPEEEVQHGPLRVLDGLSAALLEVWGRAHAGGIGEPPPSAPAGGPPATLTYIGPQSSGTLGTVFGELCDALPDGAQAFHSFSAARPLRVISATATGEARGLIPAERCDLGLGRIDGQPRRYASLPPELGVRFLRSIVTDDELMALAVEELRLRNVHPLPRDASCRAGGEDGTGDFVVTISELDTAYGRALPRAFVNALCDAGGCCGSNAAGQRSIPNVLEYGYMRGLDGLVRPAVVGDDQGRRTADLRALAEHASESYIEPAVGSGQFDYLRRLANQLRDKDAELRRDGKGGIRAFGILGNDHYDKLLILQALREHFPDHHYFTSDLDARLLDPEVLPAVKNLIVLSSFNLRLAEPLQRRVPPFRNHYQTSIFLAGKLIGAEQLSGIEQTLEAQVFEVGHGRFFRLRTLNYRQPQGPEGVEPAALGQCLQSGGGACPPLNPPPWEYDSLLEGRFGVVALVLVVLAVLTWLMMPGAWSWTRDQLEGARSRAAAVLRTAPWNPLGYLSIPPAWLWPLLGAATLLWAMYLAMRETLEPFVPASGVSIWPAELIRTLAGLVAAYLAYSAWKRLRDCDDALEKDFELGGRDSPATGNGSAGRGDGNAASAALADRQRGSGPFQTLAEFQGWVNESRPLSRRRELEIQTLRLKRLLRGEKRPESGAGHGGRRGPDFEGVWRRYRGFSGWSARLRQALPVAGLLLGLAVIVILSIAPDRIHTHRAVWPSPDAPMRLGDIWNQAILWWPEVNGLIFLAVPFALLIVGILQEVLICNRLVKEVRDVSLNDGVWRSLLGDDSGRRENYLLTVFFIARRTETTSDVVWFPLVVWALVILSLNTRFDNFEPTAGILFMLALALALSLAPLLLLRRAARWVRTSILDALKNDVFSTRRKEAATPGEESQVIIDRIEEMRIGAFRPWYQEPVVQVLFWILSFGTLVITEYIRTGG